MCVNLADSVWEKLFQWLCPQGWDERGEKFHCVQEQLPLVPGGEEVLQLLFQAGIQFHIHSCLRIWQILLHYSREISLGLLEDIYIRCLLKYSLKH